MEFTVDEILTKLNLAQLKSLITLYGLEKPHSKSTKSDYIAYIQTSGIVLDPRMLINYFSLALKQKKIIKAGVESLDISNVEVVGDSHEPIVRKRSRSPRRRASKS